jgi:hypothetical protein
MVQAQVRGGLTHRHEEALTRRTRQPRAHRIPDLLELIERMQRRRLVVLLVAVLLRGAADLAALTSATEFPGLLCMGTV